MKDCKNFKDFIDKIGKGSEALILSHYELTVDDINILAQAIKASKSLRSLTFHTNKIEGENAELLLEAFKYNSSVYQLDIISNAIGDKGAKVLAEVLKCNKTLRYISLSYNLITEKGAKYLAAALESNTILLSLDLSRNIIKDEGAEALAIMLKINKSIRSLDLVSNAIGVEGSKLLAAAIMANTSLGYINLHSNPIRKEGSKALELSVKRNPNIQYLYCEFPSEWLKEFLTKRRDFTKSLITRWINTNDQSTFTSHDLVLFNNNINNMHCISEKNVDFKLDYNAVNKQLHKCMYAKWRVGTALKQHLPMELITYVGSIWLNIRCDIKADISHKKSIKIPVISNAINKVNKLLDF